MKHEPIGMAALTVLLLATGQAIAAQPTLSINMAALVTVTGSPGTSYALQAATEVNGPTWRTLDSKEAGADGSLNFTDPIAGKAQRFYRVVELQLINVNAGWDRSLDVPFARYRLTEDLSNLSAPLTIGAEHVILDLNGHTMGGTGNGTGIKVTGFDGAFITGGTLTNFKTAVFLEQANGAHLKALTVVGIGATNDGWAIHATNSTGLRIQRCDLSNTHNPAKLEQVTQSEVDHCLIHDNDKGIFLTAGSTGNRVHNNLVQDSPNVGIIADTQSNENEFYANTCERTMVGIEIDASDANVIHDNTANENRWGGIWIRRGANNVVRHNTTLRNGTPTFVRWGILVGFPKAFGGPLYATGTRVEDNTALDNADSHPTYGAYQIDMFDNSLWDKKECENTWRNNAFVKDNETGADYGPDAGCIR